MKVEFTSISTFAGPLWIGESARGLCHVGLAREADQMPSDWQHVRGKTSAATQQLQEYFAGERTGFTLPLDIRGTAFQMSVWAALQAIPYGSTASYMAIARALGKPGASRAVGSANARNCIAIVVPCHRVIASDGGLAGFAWGTQAKRMLLELEQSWFQRRRVVTR